MHSRRLPKPTFSISGLSSRKESEDAADRVETEIYNACSALARAPFRGHSRPDLTSRDLRFWTLPRYTNYTVVYRPGTTPLQVLAVLHGKRNIPRLLEQR